MDKLELTKTLFEMDDETFKIVKDVFIDSRVKFYKADIYSNKGAASRMPIFFNVCILKHMNETQLKYLMSLANEELEQRGLEHL